MQEKEKKQDRMLTRSSLNTVLAMLSLSFQGMLSERYTYIRVGPKSFFLLKELVLKVVRRVFFSRKNQSQKQKQISEDCLHILNGT